LENVTKSFDDQVVLKNLTLDVRKNEFLTLLGPSGCGKTTTLRLIGGFEKPDEGIILHHGNDISNLPPYKRNVNTVFQKYALFPHLNVYENIAFGLKIKKMNKSLIKEKVEKALRQVNLVGYENRRIDQLSGGQQQMLAIARALVAENRLLLIDEPSEGLAPIIVEQIMAALRQMATETTILLVEQNFAMAAQLADEYYILDDGRSVQHGKMADLVHDQATINRYLGAG